MKEEKITQTQYWSNIIRFHPFTCLFVILHKEITMASPLSVYVPYITWVWQYTRNEQINSTTYPHRDTKSNKMGVRHIYKGRQPEWQRVRKERGERKSVLFTNSEIIDSLDIWQCTSEKKMKY